MPQVSRRIVSKKIEEKIFETLWEAFATLKTPKEIKSFLEDLLSPVERTMLAKRMAIAALLAKGYTYQSINETLKVSQETISSVSLTLANNIGYKLAINKIARSEATREFWQDIQKLAHRLGVAKDTFKAEEYLDKKFKFGPKTLV